MRANVEAGASLFCTPTAFVNDHFIRHIECQTVCRNINTQIASAMRLCADEYSGNDCLVVGVIEPMAEVCERGKDNDFYLPQISALVQGGVDALIIENLRRREDISLVESAIRRYSPRLDIPLVVSCVVEFGTRLPCGELFVDVARELTDCGVKAVGIELRGAFDTNPRLLETMTSLSTMLFGVSIDTQMYPEDLWSRSEEYVDRIFNFYEECLSIDNCWMIGGGRGSRIADTARGAELLRRR